MSDIPQWACTNCGQSFTPAAWMIARSFRQCPDCKRAYERAYRQKRRAEGNPVAAVLEDTAKRRERYARLMANPSYRESRNQAARARYADPVRQMKVKARSLTQRAIESGRLIRQPCEVCGTAPAEAHHDDYSKPMVIRWLCRAHHREHHRRAG